MRAGDLLAAEGDAIVLPVDGTFFPRQGQFDRLLGSIGSQFLRRYPDAELLDEIEAQVSLPLALGEAASVELTGCPFRAALLVSILHHAQEVPAVARARLVGAAFGRALQRAEDAQLTRIVTPVLQGGWRLDPRSAVREMAKAYRASKHAPEVTIYAIDPQLVEQLAAHVQ